MTERRVALEGMEYVFVCRRQWERLARPTRDDFSKAADEAAAAARRPRAERAHA